MYEDRREIEQLFDELPDVELVEISNGSAWAVEMRAMQADSDSECLVELPRTSMLNDRLLQNDGFRREWMAIDHPLLLRCREFEQVRIAWNGVVERRVYIKSEVTGVSLRDRIGALKVTFDEDRVTMQGGGMPLPLVSALDLAIAICECLKAYYTSTPARILGEPSPHADICPENIYLGDDEIIRLNPSGLAGFAALHCADSWRCRMIYAAPEVIRGEPATQASDVFSLGATLFEMLTGQTMRVSTDETEHVRSVSDIDSQIPTELSDHVAHAVKPNPAERFASIADFRLSLVKFQAGFRPMPTRYRAIGENGDDSTLCIDEKTQRIVSVRVSPKHVELEQLGRRCDEMERLNIDEICIPQRIFDYAGFIGIESPPSNIPSLSSRLAGLDEIERLKLACDTVLQIAEILHRCHKSGVIYGCLAPCAIGSKDQTIELRECMMATLLSSESVNPKAGSTIERFGLFLPFISPELISRGVPVAADDIYSLGKVFIFTVSGTAARPVVVPADLQSVRDANRFVPVELATLAIEMTHEDPSQRPALERVVEGLSDWNWPEDVVNSLLAQSLETFHRGGTPAQLLQATDLVERAIQLDPGCARAHNTLGEIYLRYGSLIHAAEENNKALAVDPSFEAYELRGRICEEKGDDLDAAICAYQQAVAFREDLPTLYRLAESLAKKESYSEAIRTVRRGLQMELNETVRMEKESLIGEWKRRRSKA